MSAVPADGGERLPTRQQIETWQTQHLDDAADRWDAKATTSVAAFEQHHRNVVSPGGTAWTGSGNEAAVNRVTTDLGVVRHHADVKREATKLARTGAEDVRATRKLVIEAITEAEDDGFAVADDLSVTDVRRYDITTIRERNQAAKDHAEFIRFRAAQLVATDKLVGKQLKAKAVELQAIKFQGEGTDAGSDSASSHVQLVDHTFKMDPPPPSPGQPQPPGGWSRDPAMEDAQRIAYGHAWEKHLSDWKGMTQEQLAERVHDMLTGDPRTDPSLHVGAIPGRSSTAIYKDGILVIHDPMTGDGGTVYRPTDGFNEFLKWVGGAGAAAPVISAPPNLPPTVPHPVENPLPTPVPHAPVALPPLPADPIGLPPWLANPSPPATPVSPVGPFILPNTPLAPNLGGGLNPGQVSAPAAAAGGLSLAAILGLLLLSPG
ncbi:MULTISPECIES: hypothetical protein [Mycolicibacterium]|uniref:hypothetical protein n=1 Tax=Mycolicibacterium TaxID=1866885 RepID=UPI000EC7D984|nr:MULTISPECIES: hypothetical protein [Mycolicibacterium]GCA97384.1 hypothetical protein NCCNTM_10190 [Mycolicibacterium sp. NCC-Tsukiji]